ncbi:MAG: tRNA guanosine(34) transglycosylase Tgt [Actinomycetia bacterium]|nr:tRNA guanosine(34) transglycosylase Tgt [Actinomycetes bacterium]
MRLEVDVQASDGAARRGTVVTARGSFEVPAFMPVGTRGTIRALSTHELASLRSSEDEAVDVMLANTYHLMLRPGAEVVARLGGLHAFSGWGGHMLTDSGGYQVFSLDPRVTEEGAEFRSAYDGSTHMLTPEGAVHTQELLGADIQMVLDVCAPLPSDRRTLGAAVDRTLRWAERARGSHRRTGDQALFGIVQGGADPELRADAATRTVALDFDGYAVGGLSVGETREDMLPALEAAVAHLPADQPRYLMGVGDPVSIVEAVARGVDMFDCVLPTRLARHGTLLTDGGRLNIKRAEFADSDLPVSGECRCPTCTGYPRGYLRHLMAVGEPAAKTLCTIHNLTWMLDLVSSIRSAITAGTLAELRSRLAAAHGDMAPGTAEDSGRGGRRS